MLGAGQPSGLKRSAEYIQLPNAADGSPRKSPRYGDDLTPSSVPSSDVFDYSNSPIVDGTQELAGSSTPSDWWDDLNGQFNPQAEIIDGELLSWSTLEQGNGKPEFCSPWPQPTLPGDDQGFELQSNGMDILYNGNAAFMENSIEPNLSENQTILSLDMTIEGTGIASDISPVTIEPNCMQNAPESDAVEPLKVEPDTCFGMITIENITWHNDPLRGCSEAYRNVVLNQIHHTYAIRDEKDSTYLGLLPSKIGTIIAQLTEGYNVELSAYLEEGSSSDFKDRKDMKGSAILCILVFGLANESQPIGDILSENSLFLQHPPPGQSVLKYTNPHILIRPGRAFDISALIQEVSSASGKESGPVGNRVRNEVLRMFSDAQGPITYRAPPISPRLSTELKSHQKKALAMMLEKESGNIEEGSFNPLWEMKTLENGRQSYFNIVSRSSVPYRPSASFGGLLADDMGLGKTLSMLALVAQSKDERLAKLELQEELANGNGMTLIVTTRPNLFTWEDQIQKHFRPESLRYVLHHSGGSQNTSAKLENIDLVVTTYEKLVSEWKRHSVNGEPGVEQIFSERWHRVVLDEGICLPIQYLMRSYGEYLILDLAHMIRNQRSKKHLALCSLNANHRWCVTGTPLQNRLEDFGALLNFLKVPQLSSRWFRDAIITPINKNSQEGFRKLRKLITSVSLRRTKDILGDLALPKRVDHIHDITLSVDERRLYRLLRAYAKGKLAGSSDKNNTSIRTLTMITKLRRTCNHGLSFLSSNAVQKLRDELLTEEDIVNLFNEPEACENCGSLGEQRFLKCGHLLCHTCASDDGDDSQEYTPCCLCLGLGSRQDKVRNTASGPIHNQPNKNETERPAKISLLIQQLQSDLTKSGEHPSKSVVFTGWTKSLDLLEQALLIEGIKYERMDGKKSMNEARAALESFRKCETSLVLIASVGTAGVGLDLTAACNIHLLEPQWNPKVEAQALDRVYRLGQINNVATHRYIAKDTIEEVCFPYQSCSIPGSSS